VFIGGSFVGVGAGHRFLVLVTVAMIPDTTDASYSFLRTFRLRVATPPPPW